MVLMLDKIIAGIAMLCMLLVIAKGITKHLHWKNADRILMKIHKPVSYCLVASGIAHGILSIWRCPEVMMKSYIAGSLCMLTIIGAIFSFQYKKKLGSHWLLWHRVFTLASIILLLTHMNK